LKGGENDCGGKKELNGNPKTQGAKTGGVIKSVSKAQSTTIREKGDI